MVGSSVSQVIAKRKKCLYILFFQFVLEHLVGQLPLLPLFCTSLCVMESVFVFFLIDASQVVQQHFKMESLTMSWQYKEFCMLMCQRLATINNNYSIGKNRCEVLR